MQKLRFIAVSTALADTVRATGKSPGYGHPTQEVHVTDGVVEPMLERLFDASVVRYVHVRDLEAGCNDLRVERAEETEAA